MDLHLAGRGRGQTANIYRVATYIEPLYMEIQTLNLINDRVAAAPPARELDLAIGKTKNSNTSPCEFPVAMHQDQWFSSLRYY